MVFSNGYSEGAHLRSPVLRQSRLNHFWLTRRGLELAAGGVAGSSEEVGWAGLAVPRLHPRYGVDQPGLIVGLVWGAWLLLVVRWPWAKMSGSLAQAVGLAVMACSFLGPNHVMMVWTYGRPDSHMPAVWMHVSFIARAPV